jgi:hypothetical protein
LQLQQLQHFQHLQHFWQIVAYIQALRHAVAVPQLPQFVPIHPSDADDNSDYWLSLAISGRLEAKIYQI